MQTSSDPVGEEPHGPEIAVGRVPQEDVHKSFFSSPSSHPRHSFPQILEFLPTCYSYSSALAIMLHGNTVRLLAGTFNHSHRWGGRATPPPTHRGQTLIGGIGLTGNSHPELAKAVADR